jgi:hypothetical protein
MNEFRLVYFQKFLVSFYIYITLDFQYFFIYITLQNMLEKNAKKKIISFFSIVNQIKHKNVVQ